MGTTIPDRSTLVRLFAPLPVIVEHQELAADPPPIHPDEAAQVEKAVYRRLVEFATGRSCARRALDQLNIRDFVLRNGPTRAPQWPNGVVGSITHTGAVPGGYCGVAVASARDVLAVGFDAEAGEFTSRDVWAKVLTPTESRWLGALPPDRQPRMARLIFSAKESFYKSQFPLTGRFLGFQDVEISIGVGSSTFDVRVAPGASVHPRLDRCQGRYVDADDLVLTAIARGH